MKKGVGHTRSVFRPCDAVGQLQVIKCGVQPCAYDSCL